MPRRAPPWGKSLGKPIECPPEEMSEHGLAVRSILYERMMRLLAHYKIDGFNWYQLAVKLAGELDQGLTTVEERPRKQTAPRWAGTEGALLISTVELVRNNTGLSDRQCLKEIQDNIYPERFKGIPLDTLVIRYCEAKRPKRRTTKRRPK
jgi:hypothetical protein